MYLIYILKAATSPLPIVEATAISFAAPLITVAMSAIFLKERVRIYRWSAVIVGFVGVLALPLAGLPIGVWGGLAGLPPGLAAARRAWIDGGHTARLVPAQGWMLLSFLLCAIGMASGLLLV